MRDRPLTLGCAKTQPLPGPDTVLGPVHRGLSTLKEGAAVAAAMGHPVECRTVLQEIAAMRASADRWIVSDVRVLTKTYRTSDTLCEASVFVVYQR